MEPTSQKPYLTEDPEKHITEAVPFFRELGVAPGFAPILTKDVKEGDTVYLVGSRQLNEETIVPQAYGPHTVVKGHEFMTKIWLKNSRGREFRVNQEELLTKYEPSENTPWGLPHSTKEYAPGIWRHATRRHAGFELSPDRVIQFKKFFSDFRTFEELPWLEEDTDGALAVLMAPAKFSEREVHEAWKTLDWKPKRNPNPDFTNYLNSPEGLLAKKISEKHQAETAQLWRAGSWITAHPQRGIKLWVTHQTTNERKYVHFTGEDPHRDYFTSEELGFHDTRLSKKQKAA